MGEVTRVPDRGGVLQAPSQERPDAPMAKKDLAPNSRSAEAGRPYHH